jgi:hypothetical protein
MTRITKALIEVMQNNAVEKAGINAQRKAINDSDEALTEDFRIASMGGPENYAYLMQLEQKHKKLRESAGSYVESSNRSSLINEEIRLHLNLAGASVTRYFIDSSGNQERRPSYNGRFVVEQGDPLIERFYSIEDDKTALANREQVIRASVYSAVMKVKTVKRLLEIWPEAAELLPTQASGEVANLPALLTDDLNKLIGLPTEAAE